MSDIKFTWFGHGTYSVTTEDGATLLLDSWVMNNPSCPEGLKAVKPDGMLISHGHYDHIGDAVELIRAQQFPVVAIFETAHWLESRGAKKTLPMNKGGSQDFMGLKVTMVHADHSCGILDEGRIIYGGEAAGYVMRFPSGLTVYFAGDTNVFGDMKLIGELYRPQVACLPIGDLFTMGPREAALAVKFLGVGTVLPMHWGTFPALTGTPELLREAARDVMGLEVVSLRPGDSWKAPAR